MSSHLPQKTKYYSSNKDDGIGREGEGQIWRGWKKNGEREEKERGKEGEKEKARETERKRRLYLSTSELSTNTKPDPKTQS